MGSKLWNIVFSILSVEKTDKSRVIVKRAPILNIDNSLIEKEFIKFGNGAHFALAGYFAIFFYWFTDFQMKLYAIMIYYKTESGVRSFKSAYDVSSFSFFQRSSAKVRS